MIITYSYDPLNRLTNAIYSSGPAFTYTLDAVGNRLTQTALLDGMPETTAYLYDHANRLSNVDGVTYTWDNNGNLLWDGVYTYTYSSANQLTSVSDGQLPATNYSYNGLGDRARQTSGGVTTDYAIDLAGGLTQVLADSQHTYLYGNGRIAQYRAGGVDYFLGDALGSVRQLVDGNGNVTLAKNYEPYGELMDSAGSRGTSYGYTSEWTDATGLVYLRARYYAPWQGRFLNRDMWDGDYNQPLSLNKWLYVSANPINLVDPTGHCYGPLSFLRNVPIESGICEHLDQAMFVYAWPGSTSGQRNLAAAYIGGWAYSHSALIVGAGGLAVAGGQAAITWLTGLYASGQFAQQANQGCQQLEGTIRTWNLETNLPKFWNQLFIDPSSLSEK